MDFYLYTSFIFLLFFFIIILPLKKWVVEPWFINKQRLLLYKNAENMLKFLDRVSNTAYLKVFKEDVLVNHGSGYRVTTQHDVMEEATEKYISLIIELVGPRLLEDLISLYGNLDAMIAHLSTDFIYRIQLDDQTYDDTDYDINKLLQQQQIISK